MKEKKKKKKSKSIASSSLEEKETKKATKKGPPRPKRDKTVQKQDDSSDNQTNDKNGLRTTTKQPQDSSCDIVNLNNGVVAAFSQAIAQETQQQQQYGTVCNLASQCMLEQLEQESVSIVILNRGIAQGDIQQGLLTYDKFRTVFPDNQDVFGVELHGASLVAVLEDALDAAANGDKEAYPCSAGIRYSVDMTAAKGNRVTDMQMRVGTHDAQWVEFDMNQTYLVATTLSLLEGNHGYETFRLIEDGVIDLNDSFYEIFASCSASTLSILGGSFRLQ